MHYSILAKCFFTTDKKLLTETMEINAALILFAFTATITPGPNNIMMMTSGVHFGIKKSIPHLLGIAFGFPSMVMLIGFGFNIVFKQYPFLHELIKILGIVYLMYLAWKIAVAQPSTMDSKSTKPLSFIKAALFQWVNPKAWVMASGAISAYTIQGVGFMHQVMIITLTFFIMAFPCVGTWLFFGVGLKRYLQNTRHQKVFNFSMASLLILSILPVIVEVVENLLF